MNTTRDQAPIASVKTREPVVALTFDDGPHVTVTAQMLGFFARENVKVTFFEVGNNVAKYPDLARSVVAAGHEIGNHSTTHPNLGKMTNTDEIRTELLKTQEIVREVTGSSPTLFRAPFLSHGPALWAVLHELQLPSIAGVIAMDWDPHTTKDSIVEYCSNVGPGDIILLHTWPRSTVEALPDIVRNLRAKGLRFVTVSEMMTMASPVTA